MPPSESLPPEVIELIVDEVADDDDSTDLLKSLSRISKAWTSPCQRHLWNLATITLYSANSGDDDHDATQLLVRRIRSRPHLGPYIRTVDYSVSTPTSGKMGKQREDLNRVAEVLKLMTNVVEFTLGYGKLRGKSKRDVNLAFDQCPVAWQEAVMGVMTAPSIEQLTLRRISRLPGPPLMKVFPNLMTLTLFKSHCLWPSSAQVPLDRSTKTSFTELIIIKCDSRSCKTFHKLWDPPSGVELGNDNLSSAIDLDFTINAPFKDKRIPRDLPELLFLRLSVMQPFDANDLPVGVFLLEVNPAAYTSLTDLSITIHHAEDDLPSMIDPLLGLASPGVLAQFTSLQKVNLKLHFDTVLVRMSSVTLQLYFESLSWDRLDLILCRPVLNSTLKKVALKLTFSSVECPDMLENLHGFIGWHCFRSLRRKAEEGELVFHVDVAALT